MPMKHGQPNDFSAESPGSPDGGNIFMSRISESGRKIHKKLEGNYFHHFIVIPVVLVLFLIHMLHSSTDTESLFRNAVFTITSKEPRPNRKINNHNTEISFDWTNYNQVRGENWKETFPNPTPIDIPTLEISFIIYEPDHLRILIKDAEKPRYELPFEEPYPHVKNPQYIAMKDSNFEAFVRYDPFDIVIRRRSTQEVIFKVSDRFMFMDVYIEFSFHTPTNQIYGFGERLRSHQFNPGTYTLFILDQSGEFDIGEPGLNQQGHHPMYLMREVSGKYHVGFLRNVNAQEVVWTSTNKITWKIIGGIIDLSFFLADTPEEAVQKYHEYIGGWTLPALWHLGHHQTKFWGYFNASHLAKIIDGFEKANLPLDVLSSDLDYMVQAKNFVLDKVNFPPDQVNELFQTHRKKWIPLIDSWIPYDRSFKDFDYDKIMTITMKNGKGETCVGDCLLGQMYLLDFLNPDTEAIWAGLLEDLNSEWTLSGFWLDANEITDYRMPSRRKIATNRGKKYFDLPFYPGKENFYNRRIVDVDCVHYGGIDEYNVRSLSSLLQSKYTYNYLKKRFAFPYILSRGSMFGGGQYASTWVADVHTNWESVVPSLGTTLSFALFGIPMVGVDICGFIGEKKTPPDLCARWYQLAIFYPFARNAHTPFVRGIDNSQEPYVFTGVYYQSIEQSIRIRYGILKHFITLFFSKKSPSTPRGTGTIMRPLLFGFHNDPTLPPYGDTAHDHQFLLGDSIMAAPVLFPNMTNLTVYFPNCRWFDLRTNSEVSVRGKSTLISAQFEEAVPHFLKGGSILLTQDASHVSNSDDLTDIFTVTIGLDDMKNRAEGRIAEAHGEILGLLSYNEDYVYDRCAQKDCVLSIKATYLVENQPKLTIKVTNRDPKASTDPVRMNEIIILGALPRTDVTFKEATLESKDIKIPIETSSTYKWMKLTFDPVDLGNGAEYTFILNQ